MRERSETCPLMKSLIYRIGLALWALFASGCAVAEQPAQSLRVDHLVYATPDLDRSINELERLLGVRAVFGGQHLGRGTRNALIALGPDCYLEILAPDPAQEPSSAPLAYGVGTLESPKLAGWAAACTDIDRFRSEAVGRGARLGRVHAGGRRRPDGVALSWRVTALTVEADGGIAPFFIDWEESPHPAQDAPKGAVLVALRAEHPDHRSMQKMFSDLGLDIQVGPGAAPVLVAIIDTPLGRVELR